MAALKQFLQRILRRAGIYHRLKASVLYDLYWRLADRRWLDARRSEVGFYRGLLRGYRPGDLIFDIGANDGTKTDVFLRMGARVIAIDPDDVNQELIRNKFLRYRLIAKPVVVVGKAVSDNAATETLWIDGPGSAINTLSQKWVGTLKNDKPRFEFTHGSLDFAKSKTVATTTIGELIDAHGVPFYIKIDVEGYEANVLRGLKTVVPYLSYEVNLPEFRPEGLECVKLLESLSDGKFNYSGDFKDGLVLKEWLDAKEFSQVLEQCSEASIEVFWKSLRIAGSDRLHSCAEH